MSERYIISDPHFGHPNIRHIPVRKDTCGDMTMQEHDEFLVDNWNRVVGKRDTVYLLGDIGMDRPMGYVTRGIIPRLKGSIHVLGGNHDTAEILQPFFKVHGVITMTIEGYRCILTHIPIHPQEMWWDYNIHGHLHGNTVKKDAWTKDMAKLNLPEDPRYICVCCEHMNYTPQLLESVVTGRGESLTRRGRNRL